VFKKGDCGVGQPLNGSIFKFILNIFLRY